MDQFSHREDRPDRKGGGCFPDGNSVQWTTRRVFLHGVSAGLALIGPISPGWAAGLAALSDDTGTLPFHTVVHEPAIATSVVFGVAAADRGWRTSATDGDITELWMRDLATVWEENPVPVAGLTSYAPLFCLERFGWDHDLRVVFRAEHRSRLDGSVEHRLAGPVSMLRAFGVAALGRQGDGACMASVLSRFPARPEASSTASFLTRSGAADQVSNPLYTWLIAPRSSGLSPV